MCLECLAPQAQRTLPPPHPSQRLWFTIGGMCPRMSQPFPASGPEARLVPPMHGNVQASESQRLQVNVEDIPPQLAGPSPGILLPGSCRSPSSHPSSCQLLPGPRSLPPCGQMWVPPQLRGKACQSRNTEGSSGARTFASESRPCPHRGLPHHCVQPQVC